MIFPGLQLLQPPKPSKPLQNRETRALPTGETWLEAEEEDRRSGGVMRKRDPAAPGAERSVRGRDTGAARLLIGHRPAERGGVGRRAL